VAFEKYGGFQEWFLSPMSDEAVTTGVPEENADTWTEGSPVTVKAERNMKRILKELRK